MNSGKSLVAKPAAALESARLSFETGGFRRAVVEDVRPRLDGGRFPIKRTIGDEVVVEADVFGDGHDVIAAVLRWRDDGAPAWSEVSMASLGNDRWRGGFRVTSVGRWRYTVAAWVDAFLTWRRDLAKRLQAGQDVGVDLSIGGRLVESAARRAAGGERAALQQAAAALAGGDVRTALSEGLLEAMTRHPDRSREVAFEPELEVVVDRERARFGAWYELFPRSASPDPGRPGTLADVAARLDHVARLGFDVLYLPPIHPIGTTCRKGRDNSPEAAPGDPGSPWAIGAAEGGHLAVHPDLGTLDDFDRLVEAAASRGIEIALDVAFQCSPDHPWVERHPEWFRKRPDGTIQYAENPPKKYQDIYPFDFESDAAGALAEALEGVFLFWIGHGVRIFRVDNPHTKPFAFWEWVIGRLKARHPDLVFLSEAFTRPKVMYRLAKLGFTQSYNYFPWRNTRRELEAYLTELTTLPVRDFFRANLWPNTPDILTEFLQTSGRPGFAIRFLLAATLGASYGIYGPAFEQCVDQPVAPGKEEYAASEKYEVRHWDLDRPDPLADLIGRVNRIRRENPALQRDDSLRFHAVDNPHLVAYSKRTPDGSNVILVVVDLDPRHRQSGWVDSPAEELGLVEGESYQVHDLLSDARFVWSGSRNYVELDPAVVPAHVFRIGRRLRREPDFEYFA